MAGMDILKLGMRRRVGDGVSIKINDDNWIPGFSSPVNFSIEYEIHVDSKVCELIDPNSFRWRRFLIFSIFNDTIANAICDIPLPVNPRPDSWFWSMSSNGHYTVKSGYKVFREMNGFVTADVLNYNSSSYCLDDFGPVLNAVWKNDLPPKYRVFLWRCCRNILPTFEALNHRGMDVEDTCPSCNEDPESCLHALLSCKLIHSLWIASGLPFVQEFDHDMPFISWLAIALTWWSKTDFNFFAIILYKMWERRNNILHDPNFRAATGSSLIESCKRLNDELTVNPVSNVHSDINASAWEPPPRGYFKVNFDGAILEDGSGGLGCIIRDHRGAMLGAVSKRISANIPPDQVEAMAGILGANMALRFGCKKIILEGDSLKVCSYPHATVRDLSNFDSIMNNLFFISHQFDFFDLVWKRRCCNKAAHTLAKSLCPISGLQD